MTSFVRGALDGLLAALRNICRPQSSESMNRTVPLGKSSSVAGTFDNNYLKTSKYSAVTFVPLSLFEQFRKAGNIYFLAMAMLMLVGMYTDVFQTPITPYTTLVPLSIVLAISMGQEGLADTRRHRADREVNNRKAMVLLGARGSVAAFERNLQPADMLRGGHGKKRKNSVPAAGQFSEGDQWLSGLSLVSSGQPSDAGHTEEAEVQPPKSHSATVHPSPSPIPNASTTSNPRSVTPSSLSSSNQAQPRSFQRSGSMQNSHSFQTKTVVDRCRKSILWQDIVPGDLVIVRNYEQIPADVVLLATSDRAGLAYVETSSIDGETNLKLRQSSVPQVFLPAAPKGDKLRSKSVMDLIRNLDGEITCEPPNISVNTFTGRLRIANAMQLLPMATEATEDLRFGADNSISLALDVENIMLRGSVLRNTRWAVGCAVYTGRDTKLAQNASHPPVKLSRVDHAVNNAIKVIFFVDLVLVTVATILLIDFEERNFAGLYYLGYWDESRSEPSLEEYIDERYPNMQWQNETSTVISGWLTFVVLFNNFIPLSMYVTIEIVTFMQLVFVNNDLHMYDAESDTPARARSNNVTDLGMIQYIFSDKTGTLTQNVMRFQLCSVAGLVYGSMPGWRDVGLGGVKSSPAGDPSTHERRRGSFELRSHQMLENLAVQGHMSECSRKVGESDDDVLYRFQDASFLALQLLRIMSLCNTVVVEESRDEDNILSPHEVDRPASSMSNALPETSPLDEVQRFGYAYQAESPDEGALVSAARDLGLELRSRSEKIVTINLRHKFTNVAPVKEGVSTEGEADELLFRQSRHFSGDASAAEQRWGLLAVNKFDAERKRMSVLVREPKKLGGRILLLMKGADNKMLDVCSHKDLPHVVAMHTHLESFGKEGLRTLVLGYRFVSQTEYAAWAVKYDRASKAVEHRSEALKSVALDIEKDILVVGATAIEDRLQDQVPETIASLAPAGVKLWVLTGDKRETAESIGLSARVLRPEMTLRVLRDGPPAEVHVQIKALYEEIVTNKQPTKSTGEEARRTELIQKRLAQIDAPSAPAAANIRRGRSDASDDDAEHKTTETDDLAVILEGPALLHVLNDAALELALFRILHKCVAVIACRVSPKQKALLVRTVKKCIRPQPVTLAIGDGANDVSMLQEAQVGVGISGKEGQQAVNSSDFAIAQFKFLKPLLMVHGRRSYRRQAKVILYSFYKNMVLVVTLFLYAHQSGYSGTAAYEDMLISGFNLFLGMPIIVAGVFNTDVTREYALQNTWLYMSGRTNRDLNTSKIIRWIVQALFHGVVIFWLGYLSYGGGGVYNAYDRWTWGTIVFSSMIQALQVKALEQTDTFVQMQYPLCTSAELLERRRGGKLRCFGIFEEPCCSRFSWTWACWYGSILFFFAYAFLYSDFPDALYEDLPLNSSFESVPHVAFSLPQHWLLFVLVPTTILALDLFQAAVERLILPFRDPVEIGTEHCRLERLLPQDEHLSVAELSISSARQRRPSTSSRRGSAGRVRPAE